MKKLVAAFLFTAIFASVFYAGAFGVGAEDGTAFSADWRCMVTLNSGPKTIEFSPEVNSLYDIGLFPEDGGSITTLRLTREGRMVASGKNQLIAMTTRLTAGQKYVLTVEGNGKFVVELMRRTAGRSYSIPEAIAGGSAVGLIVRAGNATWYSFTGDGGPTTVYVAPGDGAHMNLEALVYDASGALVAQSVPFASGACAAYVMTESGCEYRMRVASPAGGSGKYGVYLALGNHGAGVPSSLNLQTGDLSMRAGTMRTGRAQALPEGSVQTLIWVSSNPAVAEVTTAGLITARNAGTTTISVYAFGALTKSFTVTVTAVKPEDIFYFDLALQMHVGDVDKPELTVYPSAASDAVFGYSSSAPDVARVSDSGEITALSEGEAVITARYGDLSTDIAVTVGAAPARYRALLVGEQMYDSGVNTQRAGSVNTVYNLESLLDTVKYQNSVACDTRVELDLTRDEFFAAISDAFADAKEDDVSILYITAHGYFRDGMSILQMVDGSEVAASDLERALRKIPGTIVLFVDCCDSGGFIGTYADIAAFTGGITAAFSGEEAPFSGSKYKVLASASLMQDSYRLGYVNSGDENDTATVFARALCDGSGWDIDEQRKSSLNADTDYNGKITLWEAYLYASRRVDWYLSTADKGTGAYAQDVQVYPKGDSFVLFDWQAE